MVAPIKSALDDGMFQLQVTDFSGGLNTNTGALSLPANQTPDALNVFAFQGRLQYRGGYSLFVALPASADMEFDFFDSSGVRHIMIWAGGNLYDCQTGTAVTISSNVYTAGAQIGVTELNNKMYWCTLAVPLRYYDGASEAPVPNSGGTGIIAPPAANFLFVYNGQIVALQPVISGTRYYSSFCWCNVNDPTSWNGANIQGVGSNDGGQVYWAQVLGIPAFVVGKSQGASGENLFLYTGALSATGLTQSPISCPVAAFDVNSAHVIPSKSGLSQIIFIGSDGHFWITNGVETWLASEDILLLTEGYIRNAILANASQKFFSTYYTRWQYYICSVGGNTQFVYRPGAKQDDPSSWWLFEGWPSGPFSNYLTSSSGLPALYCAANSPGQTGLYQVAQDQVGDNGGNPNPVPYYVTPYLHGGKIEREKQFNWFMLSTYNIGVQYSISAYTMPRSDGYIYTADQINVQDPAAVNTSSAANVLTWNVNNWNTSVWGGGISTVSEPYQPCVNHARLQYTSLGTAYVMPGEKGSLRSGAIQIKISWAGGVSDFQMLGYNVRYVERSAQYVGNQPSQAQGGIITTVDPYSNTGAT